MPAEQLAKFMNNDLLYMVTKLNMFQGNINLKFTLTWTWWVVLLCVPPAVIIVSNLFISKEPLISKWGFFKLIVLNIKIRSTTTNPLCICSCIRVLLKIFILFYCGIQFARAAILFLPPTIHNLEKRVTWKNQTLWLMGLV